METITNAVSAVSATATKAIWGEQPSNETGGNETGGNEPASGVQGKGTPTEPYDGGNAEDTAARNDTVSTGPLSGLEVKGTASDNSDATNVTSLPIREKTSSTDITDSTPTLATRPDETNTAGLAGTENLSETLAKTHLSKTDTDLKPSVVSAAKAEPPLAGFSASRSIDPADKSQLPAEVSNATTGDSLTSSTPATSQSAGPTGTLNLSDTLAKTNPPTLSPTTSPKASPAADIGNASQDMLGTTKGTGEHTISPVSSGTVPAGITESSRIMESKGVEDKEKKEESPSGEKEKVSKMEKLKEKLHIGHKH